MCIYVQYDAEDNSLVKTDCNACGIQVNLSPDMQIAVCQTKDFPPFTEIITGQVLMQILI